MIRMEFPTWTLNHAFGLAGIEYCCPPPYFSCLLTPDFSVPLCLPAIALATGGASVVKVFRLPPPFPHPESSC